MVIVAEMKTADISGAGFWHPFGRIIYAAENRQADTRRNFSNDFFYSFS